MSTTASWLHAETATCTLSRCEHQPSVANAAACSTPRCLPLPPGTTCNTQNGERIATVIELETLPLGIVRIDAPGKQVIVATMNNSVHSFHIKVRGFSGTSYMYITRCMGAHSLTAWCAVACVLWSRARSATRCTCHAQL